MRPVILFLFLSSSFAVFSQADTSYHLLWYQGKKIKPNVLLTPGGDTISFNPSKGELKVVSKSGRGKKYDDMLAELNHTPLRIQQMIGRLSKLPKPMQPEYAKAVYRGYNEVKDHYTAILSNVITFPAPLNIPRILTGKGGMPGWDDPEEEVEKVIREFRQYYADHQYDNLKNVPEPPLYDYSYCYEKDKAKQDAYGEAMKQFKAELSGSDIEMLQKAFSLSRTAYFLYPEGAKQRRVFREAEMMVSYTLARMALKVSALVEKYIDDAERAPAVLDVTQSIDRMRVMLGVEGVGEDDMISDDYLVRAIIAVRDRVLRAFDERDYPVALNLEMMFGAERQMYFTGVESKDLLEKALRFNQFKLSSDISAKVSGDGGYMLSQLRGDNWFFAAPDSNCRLKWVQLGPLLNKSKYELVAAELRSNGGVIPYVGTKTWVSDVPKIKVDFCTKEEQDSITAYPFYPDGFKELWQYPPPVGATNVSQMSTVLLGCFVDAERTKADAAYYRNPDNVAKLQKDMMAQYEKLSKDFRSGKITASQKIDLRELSKFANMQDVSRNMTDLIHSADPGRYIFEPTVYNKDKVIIKDKLNGKVLFPGNTATEYAWFHLALEHDPDGPYKVTL
ncbi:MAG: hypothetical protein JNN00_01875 [Chitinophagaceae bacterium]|nr:hypothetical protein [Chitinophagaceae bacterium]